MDVEYPITSVRRTLWRLAPRLAEAAAFTVSVSCLELALAFLGERFFPYFLKYVIMIWKVRSFLASQLEWNEYAASIGVAPALWLYFREMFPPIYFPTIIMLEALCKMIMQGRENFRRWSRPSDDASRVESLAACLNSFILHTTLKVLARAPKTAPEPVDGDAFLLTWLMPSAIVVVVLNAALSYGASVTPLFADKAADVVAYSVFPTLVAVYEAHLQQLESLPVFEHRALKAGEIRLVKLREFAYGEPVTVELYHAALDRVPKYIACSYAWGTKLFDRKIRVIRQSGASFQIPVTKSVFDILSREYFLNNRQGFFWIDAICINQEDDVERAAQVSMMRSIYESAAMVKVYLDPSLRPFSNHWLVSDEVSLRAILPAENRRQMVELAARSCRRESLPRELEELAGASWHSRVWAVQEAAVAKSIVFVYRTAEIQRDPYHELSIYLYRMHSRGEFDESLRLPPNRQLPTMLRSNDMQVVSLYYSKLGYLPGYDESDLGLCLNLGQTKECEDPRDRVYAFLGLTAEKFRQNLPIDYSIPASELYVKVMRKVLTQSRNFVDLAVAEQGHVESAVKTPSWVSQWRNGRPRMTYLQLDRFAAATSQPWPGLGDSANLNEIWIPTCSVETIRALMPYSDIAERLRTKIPELTRAVVESDSKLVADFMRSRWSFALANADRKRNENLAVLKQALWKTMVWDQIKAKKRRADASDKDDFDLLEWAFGLASQGALYKPAPIEDHDVWRQGPPGELPLDNKKRASRYTDTMTEIMSYFDQRLGVTESGRLGLFPRHAQVGDTVALFASAKVPFVIRAAGLPGDGANRHTLVGSCYVHGIMDGEAATGPWTRITLV